MNALAELREVETQVEGITYRRPVEDIIMLTYRKHLQAGVWRPFLIPMPTLLYPDQTLNDIFYSSFFIRDWNGALSLPWIVNVIWLHLWQVV